MQQKDSIQPVRVLTEGMYLATSWTWCIGMFLPVILLRDFGWWAWVAFALPNVIGAAAMGAALKREGASQAMVAAHAPMMRVFSIVTLAFQAFFLAWLFSDLDSGLLRAAMLALVLCVLILPGLHSSWPIWSRVSTGVVYVISLACAGLYVAQVGLPILPATKVSQAADLALLAPVLIVGFALCPYLDLSFHAARQRTPGRTGTLAFVVGFGVLFLAMIVFTLFYTPAALNTLPLSPAAAATRIVQGGSSSSLGGLVLGGLSVAGLAVLVHLVAQAAITAGIHQSFSRRHSLAGSHAGVDRNSSSGVFDKIPTLAWVALLLVPVGILIGMPSYAGLSMFELCYRAFMGFYGLIFPAYVWVCVLPTFGLATKPTKRHWRAFVIAVVIAMPFFWFGFIEREYVMLVPGVLALLASRLLLVLK